MARRIERLLSDFPVQLPREIGDSFRQEENYPAIRTLRRYETDLQAFVEKGGLGRFTATTDAVNEVLKLGDRMVDALNRAGQQRTPELLKDLLGTVEAIRDDVRLIETNTLAKQILDLELHTSQVAESFRTEARQYVDHLGNLWNGAKQNVSIEFRKQFGQEMTAGHQLLINWTASLNSRNPKTIRDRTIEVRDGLNGVERKVADYLRSHDDPGLRNEFLPKLRAIKLEMAARLRELNLPVG
jgi:hypothetical protein